MARRRQAPALLGRLREVSFQRLMREVLDLPCTLSRPVTRLAAVLRVPPALLWAGLATLLGSAVLAVSWILTALIIALTRPPLPPPDATKEPGAVASAPDDDGIDADATSDTARGDGVGGVGGHGCDMRRAGGNSSDTGSTAGKPNPLSSWAPWTLAPVGDEAGPDSDEEAGGGGDGDGDGGDSGVGKCDGRSRAGDLRWRRLPPGASKSTKKDAAEQEAAYGIPSAWARLAATAGPTAGLPVRPPYLDEQQATEIRRHVSRAAAVIPATAFEAARGCDVVFGLGLDVGGYRQLLMMPPDDVSDVGAASGGHVEAETETEELPQEGTAALGRLALHAHLARYLYGMHGGGTACAVAAVAGGSGAAAPAGEPADVAAAPAPAPAAAAAAAAVLIDTAAFVRPDVLASLARRLRLDLLMTEPPELLLRTGPSSETTGKGGGAGGAGGSSHRDNPRVLALRRAAAAAARGSGAGGGGVPAAAAARAGSAMAPPPTPAAQAAALLRLVWEAHVADPGRAWLAVCVLAGLARELRLVSGPAS